MVLESSDSNMKNRDGFAVKEMIILSGVLALVFAFFITKVSFAYSDAIRVEDCSDAENNALLIAAESYVKYNKEKFKDEEIFVYGSDLIDAGFLLDIDDFDYKNKKMKVVYDKSRDKYIASIED